MYTRTGMVRIEPPAPTSPRATPTIIAARSPSSSPMLLLSSGFHSFIQRDQAARRRIMQQFLVCLLKLLENRQRKLFAKLNTPLVERIDIPDHPLDKDFELIHGDKRSECPGGQFPEEDGVSRTVPFEHLMWKEEFNFFFRLSLAFELLFRLDRCFSLQERFGLSKEI